MWSKGHRKLTPDEKAHLEAVKGLPCSVCDEPGPSSAHHIKQQRHYTAVAVCMNCHQGWKDGWHGQKAAWRLRKMDEIDALDVTIQRLRERSENPDGM